MNMHSGRFELSKDKFKERVKKTGKDAHQLDFRALFPKLFSGSNKMPRRIELIWRKVVDDFLDKEGGYYTFQEKGCFVLFTFENAIKAMAKAKVDLISKAIKEAVEKSIEHGENTLEISENSGNRPEQGDKKSDGDESLKKVLEGLRENPDISEVKIWSGRALQNLHLSKALPPQDMQKLQEGYKPCYVPFWNAESNVLVGASCELNPRGTPASDEGQLIRDNIAQITKAYLEISRLHKSNAQAVVVIPIYVRALLEKEVSELILTFLKNVPETVRKSMIFELREMGKNMIPAAAKEPLTVISQICRALIIDTGILSQPDMSAEPFKIHAYGCNYNDVNLPPEQRLNLMKKYVSAYKARGTKTYIRNIPNLPTLEAANTLGFAYISAPGVLNPKLSCPTVSRMALVDIKALGKTS